MKNFKGVTIIACHFHLLKSWRDQLSKKFNSKWFQDPKLVELFRVLCGMSYLPFEDIREYFCTYVENLRNEITASKSCFNTYIVYLLNNYIGPNPRFDTVHYDYYSEILTEPFHNITSNSIESLNRKIKDSFPSGNLTWKRTVKILRDFHLKIISDIYHSRLMAGRLIKQRKIIRLKLENQRAYLVRFKNWSPKEKEANWFQLCLDLADINSHYKNIEFLKEKPEDEIDESEVLCHIIYVTIQYYQLRSVTVMILVIHHSYNLVSLILICKSFFQ